MYQNIPGKFSYDGVAHVVFPPVLIIGLYNHKIKNGPWIYFPPVLIIGFV